MVENGKEVNCQSYYFTLDGLNYNARYVKVAFELTGTWAFADELEVRGTAAPSDTAETLPDTPGTDYEVVNKYAWTDQARGIQHEALAYAGHWFSSAGGALQTSQKTVEELLPMVGYVDGEGNALSPLYTWQDGRGGLPLSQGKSACQLLGEKGARCAPGYGMGTHLYNLKMGLVPPEAQSFCTLADWLGVALTGRERPLLHQSQAAALGLYDSASRSFQEEIARSVGMNPALFPSVTGELSLLGEYRGVPVSVSLGDNQASFLGSVRQARQTLLVNVGTGAQISLYAERPFQAPGAESRPFLGSSCLLVGSTLCGGAAYAALEGFFREYAVVGRSPGPAQS